MVAFDWRENIKVYRKNIDLTQAELAFKMGVKAQTISNWELGISAPDVNELQQLSKIFGISISDFFTDTNLIKRKEHKKSIQFTT